ncbi:unnamed protein product, partial [Brenthis ino]
MKLEKPGQVALLYDDLFVKLHFCFTSKAAFAKIRISVVVRTGAEAERSVVLFQEHRLAFSTACTGIRALYNGVRGGIYFSGHGVMSYGFRCGRAPRGRPVPAVPRRSPAFTLASQQL